MTDYRPVSCEIHSQYELLAMQGRSVRLYLTDDNGVFEGKIRDMLTREKIEYLLFEMGDGRSCDIRLDTIKQFEVIG